MWVWTWVWMGIWRWIWTWIWIWIWIGNYMWIRMWIWMWIWPRIWMLHAPPLTAVKDVFAGGRATLSKEVVLWGSWGLIQHYVGCCPPSRNWGAASVHSHSFSSHTHDAQRFSGHFIRRTCITCRRPAHSLFCAAIFKKHFATCPLQPPAMVAGAANAAAGRAALDEKARWKATRLANLQRGRPAAAMPPAALPPASTPPPPAPKPRIERLTLGFSIHGGGR